MNLPRSGARVKAMTYGSFEYNEKSKEVTGILAMRKSPFDGPPQCWVDGVQVDPDTVEEIDINDNVDSNLS